MRFFKSTLITVLFCCMMAAVSVHAEDKPTATVEITSKSVAIGIGITWGDGILTYQGKKYNFSVKGLSIVDLGISKISVAGDVYGLNKLDDFNGTYMSASADIVVGGGPGASIMKNQNDVVIKLKSTQKGLKLKLAPEGVSLTLKK